MAPILEMSYPSRNENVTDVANNTLTITFLFLRVVLIREIHSAIAFLRCETNTINQRKY